jgi:hypothetical protein
MKTLLIITGPQGSGNHLFSKIFAQHPDVFAWSALNDQYWVPHDQEPFVDAWHNPFILPNVVFDTHAVTSISCPYAYHGQTVEPRYAEFIAAAERLGYKIKVAIIGRDQNVLRLQQERVRGTYSYPKFEKYLNYLQTFNPVYLSTELLYLYRENYVSSLSAQLDFPINCDPEQISKILETDPNSKYFAPAPDQALDKIVKKVSSL